MILKLKFAKAIRMKSSIETVFLDLGRRMVVLALKFGRIARQLGKHHQIGMKKHTTKTIGTKGTMLVKNENNIGNFLCGW